MQDGNDPFLSSPTQRILSEDVMLSGARLPPSSMLSLDTTSPPSALSSPVHRGFQQEYISPMLQERLTPVSEGFPMSNGLSGSEPSSSVETSPTLTARGVRPGKIKQPMFQNRGMVGVRGEIGEEGPTVRQHLQAQKQYWAQMHAQQKGAPQRTAVGGGESATWYPSMPKRVNRTQSARAARGYIAAAAATGPSEATDQPSHSPDSANQAEPSSVTLASVPIPANSRPRNVSVPNRRAQSKVVPSGRRGQQPPRTAPAKHKITQQPLVPKNTERPSTSSSAGPPAAHSPALMDHLYPVSMTLPSPPTQSSAIHPPPAYNALRMRHPGGNELSHPQPAADGQLQQSPLQGRPPPGRSPSAPFSPQSFVNNNGCAVNPEQSASPSAPRHPVPLTPRVLDRHGRPLNPQPQLPPSRRDSPAESSSSRTPASAAKLTAQEQDVLRRIGIPISANTSYVESSSVDYEALRRLAVQNQPAPPGDQQPPSRVVYIKDAQLKNRQIFLVNESDRVPSELVTSVHLRRSPNSTPTVQLISGGSRGGMTHRGRNGHPVPKPGPQKLLYPVNIVTTRPSTTTAPPSIPTTSAQSATPTSASSQSQPSSNHQQQFASQSGHPVEHYNPENPPVSQQQFMQIDEQRIQQSVDLVASGRAKNTPQAYGALQKEAATFAKASPPLSQDQLRHEKEEFAMNSRDDATTTDLSSHSGQEQVTPRWPTGSPDEMACSVPSSSSSSSHLHEMSKPALPQPAAQSSISPVRRGPAKPPLHSYQTHRPLPPRFLSERAYDHQHLIKVQSAPRSLMEYDDQSIDGLESLHPGSDETSQSSPNCSPPPLLAQQQAAPHRVNPARLTASVLAGTPLQEVAKLHPDTLLSAMTNTTGYENAMAAASRCRNKSNASKSKTKTPILNEQEKAEKEIANSIIAKELAQKIINEENERQAKQAEMAAASKGITAMRKRPDEQEKKPAKSKRKQATRQHDLSMMNMRPNSAGYLSHSQSISLTPSPVSHSFVSSGSHHQSPHFEGTNPEGMCYPMSEQQLYPSDLLVMPGMRPLQIESASSPPQHAEEHGEQQHSQMHFPGGVFSHSPHPQQPSQQPSPFHHDGFLQLPPPYEMLQGQQQQQQHSSIQAHHESVATKQESQGMDTADSSIHSAHISPAEQQKNDFLQNDAILNSTPPDAIEELQDLADHEENMMLEDIDIRIDDNDTMFDLAANFADYINDGDDEEEKEAVSAAARVHSTAFPLIAPASASVASTSADGPSPMSSAPLSQEPQQSFTAPGSVAAVSNDSFVNSDMHVSTESPVLDSFCSNLLNNQGGMNADLKQLATIFETYENTAGPRSADPLLSSVNVTVTEDDSESGRIVGGPSSGTTTDSALLDENDFTRLQASINGDFLPEDNIIAQLDVHSYLPGKLDNEDLDMHLSLPPSDSAGDPWANGEGGRNGETGRGRMAAGSEQAAAMQEGQWEGGPGGLLHPIDLAEDPVLLRNYYDHLESLPDSALSELIQSHRDVVGEDKPITNWEDLTPMDWEDLEEMVASTMAIEDDDLEDVEPVLDEASPETYKQRSDFMKQNIRALTQRNAASINELCRLKLLIKLNEEELKVLARRLGHHHRNTLRRLSNQLRKKELLKQSIIDARIKGLPLQIRAIKDRFDMPPPRAPKGPKQQSAEPVRGVKRKIPPCKKSTPKAKIARMEKKPKVRKAPVKNSAPAAAPRPRSNSINKNPRIAQEQSLQEEKKEEFPEETPEQTDSTPSLAVAPSKVAQKVTRAAKAKFTERPAPIPTRTSTRQASRRAALEASLVPDTSSSHPFPPSVMISDTDSLLHEADLQEGTPSPSPSNPNEESSSTPESEMLAPSSRSRARKSTTPRRSGTPAEAAIVEDEAVVKEEVKNEEEKAESEKPVEEEKEDEKDDGGEVEVKEEMEEECEESTREEESDREVETESPRTPLRRARSSRSRTTPRDSVSRDTPPSSEDGRRPRRAAAARPNPELSTRVLREKKKIEAPPTPTRQSLSRAAKRRS